MELQRRVLVIEDDAAIRRGLVDALRFDCCHVFEAGNATDGLDRALAVDVHLILLDLLLPGGDGFEILKQVRQQRPTMPVIILTARGDEADRVKGLRLGADDYVVKPFSVNELLARVHAVLRRSPQRPVDVPRLDLSHAHIDLLRREARFQDGSFCELSEKEIELLRYLAANSGRVVSREELLRSIWLIEPRGLETRTVDMHVARLRQKLRDDPASPRILVTVRGQGYKLATPSPGETPA